MRSLAKKLQSNLTPRKAYGILIDGNRRFVNNLRQNRNLLGQVNETSEGPHPFAIVLSCFDSRAAAELIFDQGLGDIVEQRQRGIVRLRAAWDGGFVEHRWGRSDHA